MWWHYRISSVFLEILPFLDADDSISKPIWHMILLFNDPEPEQEPKKEVEQEPGQQEQEPGQQQEQEPEYSNTITITSDI